ncbi:MAG: GNAT family N-acetyltransferase [Hyphomicrobiales bacterium]
MLLRPLRQSDLVPLASALNNYRIVRNTARIPWPYTVDDARQHLDRLSQTVPGTLQLTIVERIRPDTILGGIGYETGAADHSAELGYWLAEPVWAKGFGYEAARAVTAHGFEVAAHERLVAGYRHGNEASRRILDRLGFRIVGHEMRYSRSAGRETPVARLELTRREWFRVKDRVA